MEDACEAFHWPYFLYFLLETEILFQKKKGERYKGWEIPQYITNKLLSMITRQNSNS